jgi:hypothetical protein
MLTVGLPVHGQEARPKPAGDQNKSVRVERPIPSTVVTCEVNQDGTQIQRNWPETSPPSYLRRLFSPEVIPNLLLVIIGGLGVSAALVTLRKLERQTTAAQLASVTAKEALELSRDTAKKQLRAYLSVKRARLIITDDGEVRARLEIWNTGQSPANRVRGATYAGLSDYPIPELSPQSEDLLKGTTVLGAGDFHVVPTIPTRDDALDGTELINLLRNPEIVYRVTGIYEYLDVFNETHTLKFQLIVGGPPGVAQRLDGGQPGETCFAMAMDQGGNEST